VLGFFKKEEKNYIGSFESIYGEASLVFDPMHRRYFKILPDEMVEWHVEKADVIASLTESGLHAPVLDIDIPHQVFKSTTEGHSHIWFDIPLSWREYKRLLKALTRAGIIEEGYYRASVARGYSAVRLPWVKKKIIDHNDVPIEDLFKEGDPF
jgi:hypothetical protein